MIIIYEHGDKVVHIPTGKCYTVRYSAKHINRKAIPLASTQVIYVEEDMDLSFEASTVKLAPTEEELKETSCDKCGQKFEIDADGIANHIDSEGNTDFDADNNHVPYMNEGGDVEELGELLAKRRSEVSEDESK